MEAQSSRLALAKRRRDTRAGWLFLLPAIITFTVFMGVPLLMAFGLIFTNYNLVSPPKWAGLGNFRRLLIDPAFKGALINTIKFFLCITPIHCILALVLAYVVSQVRHSRLRSLYRGLIYFPTIVTTASVTIVWTYIFATDTGFVNYYIRSLGGVSIPWLTDKAMMYVTIALFSAWKFIGTTFLYYFVGLQNVPQAYQEAAMIDGASRWRTFWGVTLPLLTPTVFFVFITNMIGVFQIFEEPFFLTPNNPNTTSLALLIYNTAFRSIRIGYGSLMAVILFVIILVVTVVQFTVQRRWVNYDYE